MLEMRNEQIGGDCIRVVHPLFQTEGDGSIPISPLQFEIETTPFLYAVELNELWHSRLPIFKMGFIKNQPFLCFIAKYKNTAYATAIWSNPVAPSLPQHTCLELRRLAIAPDAPKNTASRMLSIMVKVIRKTRPAINRVISYQDVEAHRGTIYKAANWIPVATHKGGSWNRRGGALKATGDSSGKANGPNATWATWASAGKR
jgi:hypothetical protein